MEYMATIERLMANPMTLVIVFITGFILFILTMREIAAWFLKLNQFEKQIREVRSTLDRVEEKLTDIQASQAQLQISTQNDARTSLSVPNSDSASDTSRPEPSIDAPQSAERTRAFPLQH